MYGWVSAWLEQRCANRVGRAWGASAEEIQMNCGRWVGALVAVHPCGRQRVVTCTDVTETLQVRAWCTAARDPDVGSGEVGSGEGGA